MPFETETERATDTSMVGIGALSPARDVVRGGGNVDMVLAVATFLSLGGDFVVLKGERIGEDADVTVGVSEKVSVELTLFESELEWSSRVLMVRFFAFVEVSEDGTVMVTGALFECDTPQDGSFMPAYVRIRSNFCIRSGSSSEPIEVAERKDVMEAWARWDCVLGQMSGVEPFEPGRAS